MRVLLKQASIPLLSLFIFTLSNGLFTTLAAVRLHLDGSSALIIGAMTGFFYAGLLLGSFRMESLISKIGHIRAFAGFASALTAIYLLHGICATPWFWLILRLLGGFSTAGLLIVIESWLLVMGTIKTRGQVLAFYMVAYYAAQALGQFLLTLGDPHTLLLYAICAICSTLAVIPLTLIRVKSPIMEEPSTLNFIKLYRCSPSGIIGCISSGLVLGGIYGLMPLFILQKTHSSDHLSIYMACIIFGAMFLQYPIGRLSDHLGRRVVLIAVCILSAITSLFAIFAFHWFFLSFVTLFIFGGLSFTLYPLSISLACDNLDTKDIIAGTQGLLLAYSIGAMTGPFIAPTLMHYFGANGLFYYFFMITVPLTLFFTWRCTQLPEAPTEEVFVPVLQTTPVSAELDPRGENPNLHSTEKLRID